MSGYSVSRLSLYAAISALEQDLRELIVVHLIPQLPPEELLGDLLEKAKDRFEKDKENFFREEALAEDLIFYIDFAESYQLLSSHKDKIPKNIANSLKKATAKLDRLIPIRNRVMHSRPLGYEDFSATLDVTTNLLQEHQEISWKNLKSTLLRLQKEPSFVLEIEIPTYAISKVNYNHNLPIPDFDETGFIGRKQQVRDLIDLCLGAYPVITIHGEGGLGKTALALKVAYEILDKEDCPFDAIAWVTSKTQQLTTQEIRRIEDAISDSLNMFKKVSDFLSGNTEQEPLEEVLSYLQEFKVLLIIDNLETILDERVRNFLSKLTKTKSKVIITSRISVGAYDYPVKLAPMDTSDSVQLLRTLAKIRGVDKQFKVDNKVIAEQCNRMHNNPAYIKWFISSVQVGKRPEHALANPDMFLDFCMSNVYQYLSEKSQKLASSMLCIPGKHNYAELAFLNDMSEVDLRESINQLLTTNMIIMSSIPRGATFESQYNLSELARDYLNRKHPVQPDFLQKLNRRRNQLVSDMENMRALASGDPYSYNSIAMRSSGDKFIAKYLFDSLRQMGIKDYEKAYKLIEEAKKLAPDYFEVYRIEALLKFNKKDYPGASRAYEIAIELAPKSAPLRKWYGSFLMRYVADFDAALTQLNEAIKLDPKSAYVQIEVARIYMYLRRYSDAEKVLEKLARREDLSEKDRRITYDLNLQFFLRVSSDSLEGRNYIRALNNVEIFRREYQSFPEYLIDQKIRDKLYQAIPIAKSLIQSIQNPDAQTKAVEILEWLYEVTGIKDDENYSIQDLISSEKVEVGCVFRGQVKKIEMYGVFIGSTSFRGLLHISEISHKFVSQDAMREIFKVGDIVKVLVKAKTSKGYEFSTKELEPNKGDILENSNLVFDNAEEMAARYRSMKT